MTGPRLSAEDEARLAGEHGPAARLAMSILVRMARVRRAPRLIDITGAHVDATIYVGDAGLEFAERLAAGGARVAVPTTLNVSGLDEEHWREWPVPEEWADKAHRQMKAYESMGAEPTWTCAPYQTSKEPAFGEQIAWGESNAVAFANSVLGARTERYPDLLDICAAVTGRVPDVGLHRTENRAGEVVLELSAVPESLARRDDFYPVLGYLTGRLAGERVAVIAGLESEPHRDQLKALCAAAASSGAVGLLHVVGVTPEAETIAKALGGRTDVERHRIGLTELRQARAELTSSEGDDLDWVVLGSPHFSLDEFRRLAPLVEGRKIHAGVELIVTTSRIVRELAEHAGLLDPLRAFGGRLTVDTCVLASPMLPEGVRRLMTCSGKYAYYSPGLLGVDVVYGSLEDCVDSAVAGAVRRRPSPWDERR